MELLIEFAAVAAVVGGIIVTRIFFTFWGAVDRKVTGEGFAVGKIVQVSGLRNAWVHVRFKSGSRLENVMVVGLCSAQQDSLYDFKHLLLLRDRAGKEYYVRVPEVECFEKLSEAPIGSRDARTLPLPVDHPAPYSEMRS